MCVWCRREEKGEERVKWDGVCGGAGERRREAGDWGKEEKQEKEEESSFLTKQKPCMDVCSVWGLDFVFVVALAVLSGLVCKFQAEELDEKKKPPLEHARQTRANRPMKGDATSPWFVRLAYRGGPRRLRPPNEPNISRVDMTHSAMMIRQEVRSFTAQLS